MFYFKFQSFFPPKFIDILLECCDKFQILRMVITNDQVRYDSVKE